MGTALVVVIIIVLTLWLNRNTWFRGSRTTTSSATKPHSTSWLPSMPSTSKRFHWAWIVVLGLVVWGGWWYTHRPDNAKPAEKPATTAAKQPDTPAEEEAFVLERECWTPCSVHIEWPSKVIWGNDPLKITYPGGIEVERRGQDQDYKAPSQVQSGEVKFASLDLGHPHFRVQVYQIVKIKR